MISLAACNNKVSGDADSQYVGNYASPFADSKVKLDTPEYKTAINSQGVKKKIAFNPETDAIPASVMIKMTCAREACEHNSQVDQGRLTCSGYQKAVTQKWPESIDRYSFSYVFEPGETTEDLSKKFETDLIDKECVVGISNYAEMKLARTNDPDLDLANPSYASSPYMDQIGYFDALGFIAANNYNGLSNVKIGIIDADFYSSNSDFADSTYITDLSGSNMSYPVEKNRIINIGGAPLATSSYGHGNFVSELIAGTSNNQISGAGVAGQVGYYGPKIVAANVYSLDRSGFKTITVDNINNALLLMKAMKVDVINMSLGMTTRASSPPDTLRYAILSAISQGSVVVVAAGNNAFNMTAKKNRDGTDSPNQDYPAAWGGDYYGLITVAALNSDATDLASFSNFGSDKVELSAPGQNMLIAGNGNLSGTSFAAPLVTGAVAVMQGYYKKQGIPVVPAQLEIALLAGSKHLPALDGRVKNGLTLHLPMLTTQISTQSLVQLPSVKLDTDGFWYTREGTSMTYGIRTSAANIDESDTTLHIGIWEKYDDSLPPLAEVPAKNGISNFQLPFYNFVVGDEGFWVVLYRLTAEGKRIFIDSKLYKFVDLIKTPTVDESNVLGAINEVNKSVSGWACLSGRPDHLQIEAHIGSPTGPIAYLEGAFGDKKYLIVSTSLQPKGREYFDACTPFTVMLGFKIPLQNFMLNTDYYFVAKHPTQPNKNKVLNTQPFRIEAKQDISPSIVNLKKSITTDSVTLKGSICWEGQVEPGVMSYHVPNALFQTSNIFSNWFLGTILSQQPELNALIAKNEVLMDFGIALIGYQNWTVTTDVGYTPRTIFGVSSDGLVAGGWSSPGINFRNMSDDSVSYVTKSNAPLPPSAPYGFGCCGYLGIMPYAFVHDNGTPRNWFLDTEQGGGTPAEAFNNPLKTDDSVFTIIRNNSVCTGLGKTGPGEDFSITYSKKTLLSNFNISQSIGLVIEGEPPAPYSNEQISTFKNQLQTIFVNSFDGLKTLGQNIVNSGDFNIVLMTFTNASPQGLQSIKIKQVPNF